MYNEIIPSIIERQNILEANERSAYQLLELLQKMLDGGLKTCQCTKNSPATMFPKTFIPLYLEALRFLIKRCCWGVTKINIHYMFEQGRFKRDFLLINLKSRQNVKNVIKKDLFKLMSNANFGPIIDEINEISYIEKYYCFWF